MKNELAISTQSAPLELVYSRDYREARIKHLDSPDKIIELINYLYVLLNVKKDNQLNQIEESVLNGVILKNFSNFSTDEIKHAFRLAVAGKLGIEMFHKLDSITMGKVLTAYKSYKANKIKNYKSNNLYTEQKKPTLAEINAIEEEFKQKCIIPYIDERKTMKQPKINWATYAIFNHFWNLKYIKLSKEDIKQYKKEAVEYWQADLKKRRHTGERVNLDEVMTPKTAKMYASCIALYHKFDDILKHIEIEVKGRNYRI
tara:strand:- start:1318 stop:2091 length:774 start_codon:yes stop_codon:yes gene_type:complete